MASMTSAQSMKNNAKFYMTVAADKAKLASANVGRGESMGLDIAIIKATASQFHVQPKEKHVRTLKQAVTPAQPRRQVTYVVAELVKRLKEATDWLTVLKSLMVIHRLMRESDITFLEELLKYSEELTRGKAKQVLNMDNFIDTSNVEGRFEFSEWVRAYGKYLDEQLEVFGLISFYQEQEAAGGASRMRSLAAKELLEQLPLLQHLLQRLVDCKPSGQATHDPVVQASLMLVLTESFKIYKAISEGLINLADRFFEMEYLEAVKGLEVYKESLVANQRLQEYYHAMEGIEDMRRAIQFPKLEPPPQDFLTQMEEYCREAPRPLDAKHPGPKTKSPPLRKGRNAAPGPKRDRGAVHDIPAHSSDPGMVLSYSQNAAPSAAAAQPQPQHSADLLDLDGLSVGSPKQGGQQPASNGNSHAAALDLLGGDNSNTRSEPQFQEEDPFGNGNSSFGGTPFGQPASQPNAGSNPFQSPQRPQANPGQGNLGTYSSQGGLSNISSQGGLGNHSSQGLGNYNSQGLGNYSSQGLGGYNSQQGFGNAQQPHTSSPSQQQQQQQQQTQPANTNPFGGGGFGGNPQGSPSLPRAQPQGTGPPAAASGFQSAAPSYQAGYQAAGPRNTAGPALKKVAATDDPFGDLTGLKPSNVQKYDPPLKTAAGAAAPQVIPAHVPGPPQGGFGQQYGGGQSFNPTKFDQDSGFGGGAFAAPKQAPPAKAVPQAASNDPFAFAGNGNSLI